MANERIERIKTEYAEYRIKVEAEGRSAQAAADAEKALNEARKAASDASYSKALGVLGRDIGELRKRTSSGAYDLPAPAPSATCPQGQRCFDRDGFDAALRDFEGEILTLVGEGATLKLRMDEAIRYANRLN